MNFNGIKNHCSGDKLSGRYLNKIFLSDRNFLCKIANGLSSFTCRKRCQEIKNSIISSTSKKNPLISEKDLVFTIQFMDGLLELVEDRRIFIISFACGDSEKMSKCFDYRTTVKSLI